MTQVSTPGIALRFEVRIDDVLVATFTHCSGLEASYEAFEWREGGDNGTVIKLPGRLSFSNVQLTRPVDTDSGKLAAWFSQQQRTPARRTAVVQLFDGNHSVVSTWTLEDAWPVHYTGPRLATTDEGDAIAVETLELAHQGLSW